MVRRRRFLRALVARTGPATTGAALAGAVILPWGLGAAAAPAQATTPRSTSAAVPVEPDVAPLRVRIASMSKASLPARGTITIRGTVTNRSDETWTTIKLYTINGTDLAPMTDPGDLAAAMDVAYDAEVGQRLTTVGEPGLIETLEPGETASYVVRVPAGEIEPATGGAPADGVHWFGIHALGQGGALPRDELADGRARTFLPYVPRRAEPVPTTLVVPMTHPLVFESDGSVADEERWLRLLSPGGRLHNLLALGEAGADAGVPITWLVDPALLDVVGRLSAGNSPRSLAATPATTDDPQGPDGSPTDGVTDPSGDPTGTPTSPDEEAASDAADADVDESPIAAAARAWLVVADEVFSSGDVVSLPYGNPDVAAIESVDPGLLDLALAQSSVTLASLEVAESPVLAAPAGYVDATLAAAVPGFTPLLVSDRFFASPAPAVARLDGRQLIVTSSGAAEGSPGPGRSVTAVGLRQRILAEAAVRAIRDQIVPDPSVADGEDAGSVSGQPLVVMLPTDWDLATAEEFFDGLDPDWVSFVDLGSATDATPGVDISATDLVDLPGTSGQQRHPLETETIQEVQDLIAGGDTLQRVLVENTRLGARVTEQALTGLSYSPPRQQRITRVSLALSRSWLDDQLGKVQISASSGVTLSGASGTFVVTLTNDLDEAVVVSIASEGDDEIVIDPIEPLELGARSRTSVLLNVTTTTSRVHTVSLMVTDADGVPLGASDQVPIRSALVSDVIWVIIGVGVGTLFVAIGLRLRRRILAARRGAPA